MRDDPRTTNAVLDLLDALYETPFDPRWWQRVGELLLPLFDADAAVLVGADRSDGRIDFALAAGFDEDAARAYVEHARRQRSAVVLDAETPQAQAIATQRDAEFWSHHGDVFYTIGGVAPVDDQVIGHFGLPRARKRGPYLSPALALLERLTPHVYRALRLSRQLARASFAEAVAKASGGSPSVAGFVVDAAGRVVFANARGEQLLADEDGLAVRRQRLQPATPADQEPLARGLAAALQPDGRDPPEAIDIRRGRGRPPLRVTIAPAPTRLLAWLGRTARGAMILARVPESAATIAPDQVRKILPITQAEARIVAALASGLEPRAIAEKYRVSVETVRAQLKSAMRRLDCHRQAELISKVLNAIGG